MKSPIFNWICASVRLLGLPLGLLCVLASGSLLDGLIGVVTTIAVVLLACRKEITQEYNQIGGRGHS